MISKYPRGIVIYRPGDRLVSPGHPSTVITLTAKGDYMAFTYCPTIGRIRLCGLSAKMRVPEHGHAAQKDAVG